MNERLLKVQQTWHTLVAGVHVGNEVLAAGMYFEQLGCRDRYNTALSGGTAGCQVVEDVRGTPDVVVVRHTAPDPHATVESRRDEDYLVMTARRVEAFPLAVLLARHCTDRTKINFTPRRQTTHRQRSAICYHMRAWCSG